MKAFSDGRDCIKLSRMKGGLSGCRPDGTGKAGPGRQPLGRPFVGLGSRQAKALSAIAAP